MLERIGCFITNPNRWSFDVKDGDCHCSSGAIGLHFLTIFRDGSEGEPFGRVHRYYEVEKPTPLSNVFVTGPVIGHARIMWQAIEGVFPPESDFFLTEIVVDVPWLYKEQRCVRQGGNILTEWEAETESRYDIIIKRIKTAAKSLSSLLDV